MRKVDLLGKKFGQLTVVGPSFSRSGNTYWVCKCDCGGETEVAYCNLVMARTVRCKHHRGQKHGLKNSPSYIVWKGMRSRCLILSDSNYPEYGGRGIKVCKRWDSFLNFLADMGERPIGLSIERKDNDGDYEPGNCEWATAKTQARNRRSTLYVTHDGKTLSLAEWSERTGISYTVLQHRLKVGKSPKAAFETPVRKLTRRASL